jgi:hypothetical protein
VCVCVVLLYLCVTPCSSAHGFNQNLDKIAADYYNVQQAPNMGNLFGELFSFKGRITQLHGPCFTRCPHWPFTIAGMMRSMMGGGQ